MLSQIELLKKYQIRVRGHLGQHLLIDANVARKIVQALDLQSGEVVVEIGPGLGALTWELLQQPVRLVAIEKDIRFVEILKQEWAERRRESQVHPDAQAEWIHADVLSCNAAEFARARFPDVKNFKVVSNLPYYITAPILFHLLEHREQLSKAILMMQREVAKRLVAKPGTRDYGRLSVAVEYSARMSALFDVSPGCFTPEPEVRSSVVECLFSSDRRLKPDLEKFFFELVQIAFSQRRKALAGLLVSSKIVTSREAAYHALQKTGLEEGIRGEKLTLKNFLELAEALKANPSKARG